MHSTSGGVGVRDAKHAPTHAPPFSLIDVSCGRCDHGRRMHVARRATSLRACGWLLPSAGGLAAPSCYPKRSLLLAAMKSACFGPAWRVPRNGQSTTLLRRFQPVSRRPVANIGCRSFATARGRGGEVADLAAARPKGDSPDLLPDLALGRPKSEAPWSDVLSWVVFSDLHLSKRSLPVCLEILRLVHATARERGAGVIFLGDLWHERGALPVEPLNAVLDEVASWQVPSLWLVGNHDQVTLSGEQHALLPLHLCSDRVHVFSRPAIFLDALWLPYRKDASELQQAIEAARLSGTSLRAVMAHVDVTGAAYNDTCQARGGLPPSLFPRDIPLYTGHYHKPHSVPGSDHIVYVGSPYQVTRSEAGQQKRFLLLDRHFQRSGDVSIDVGPRHFRVRVPAMDAGADGDAGAGLASALAALGPKGGALRAGDRVRVELPEAPDREAARTLQAAQKRGVFVEVAVDPRELRPRIQEAECMLPEQLLSEFAAQGGMSAPALRLAREILADSVAARGTSNHDPVDLDLYSVEMEGFGPFLQPTRYSFRLGGLRMVSGDNRDDLQAESNGAGKSTLALAALWAFTGSTDARDTLTRDLQRAEVVHDAASGAAVVVEGTVNGVAFCVRRESRARGSKDGGPRKSAGSGLTLELGGEDRTQATQQLTQALIDATFGTAYLPGAVFMTHGSVQLLLQATDKEFRDALGLVVQLDLWDSAKAVARKRLQAAERELAAQAAREEQAAAGAARLRSLVDRERELRDEWGARHRRQRAQQLERAEAVAECALDAVRSCGERHAALAATLEGLAADLERVAQSAASVANTAALGGPATAEEGLLDSYQQTVAPLRERLAQATEAAREARARWAEAASVADVRRGALLALRRRLQEYVSLGQAANGEAVTTGAGVGRRDGHSVAAGRQASEVLTAEGREATSSAVRDHEHGDAWVCDRCLQPIDEEMYSATIADLRAEVAAEEARMQEAEGIATALKREWTEREGQVQAAEAELARRDEELGRQVAAARRAREEEQRRAEEARRAAGQAHATASRAVSGAWAEGRRSGRAAAELGAMAVELCHRVRELTAPGRPGTQGEDVALLETLLAKVAEAAPRDGELGLEEGLNFTSGVRDPWDKAPSAASKAQPDGRQMPADLGALEEEAQRVAQRAAGVQGQARLAAEESTRALKYLGEVSDCVRQLAAVVDHNPHGPVVEAYERQLDDVEGSLQELQRACDALQADVGLLREVDGAFSRKGVQAYLMESAVAELQDTTQGYLSRLSGRLSIRLTTVSERKTPRRGAVRGEEDGAEMVERVEKAVTFCPPSSTSGATVTRSVAQLSGGERMRVALCLSLGMMDLLRCRSRLACNVLVMDEVLQRMDAEGVSQALTLLRSVGKETVLLVGQPGGFGSEVDAVDTVVKEGGSSWVVVGSRFESVLSL